MKRRDFIGGTATAALAIAACSVTATPFGSDPGRAAGSGGIRTKTAARIRRELRIALLDSLKAWYPRCLDKKYGGFLCDFDARWNPTGPHDKMLEYQARQTRAAAQAALYDSALATCREAAEHGFRYLRDRMWDDRHGGWFRKLDRAGRALEGETKHGHGTAYAIQACIEHHRLTGSPESLKLAYEAFLWLEKHAHDAGDGGYFSFYQRDGTLILSAEQNPISDHRHDQLGTPVGLRDENTALDLLEALADLYSARTDPLIRKRLTEVLELCMRRLIVAPGLLQKHYYRDWSPAPSEVELGVSLQASMSLTKASAALFNTPPAEIKHAARLLVDSCVRYAWDHDKGGFYYLGKVEGGNVAITSHDKEWWVQAEGLRALLAMARLYDINPTDYWDFFQRQWKYIRNYIVDTRHKGWNKAGIDTAAGPGVKAQEWKDASHEVRALIQCIQALEDGHAPRAQGLAAVSGSGSTLRITPSRPLTM